MIGECINGKYITVEMHIATKNGMNFWVCECSGSKECEGCQFSLPDLVKDVFILGLPKELKV